jgi:hypothetical protein
VLCSLLLHSVNYKTIKVYVDNKTDMIMQGTVHAGETIKQWHMLKYHQKDKWLNTWGTRNQCNTNNRTGSKGLVRV